AAYAGTVERRALTFDGERVVAVQVDREHVRRLDQMGAGRERDDVMRAVAARLLGGEVDLVDVGGKFFGAGYVRNRVPAEVVHQRQIDRRHGIHNTGVAEGEEGIVARAVRPVPEVASHDIETVEV